jgi:hypothetical protein
MFLSGNSKHMDYPSAFIIELSIVVTFIKAQFAQFYVPRNYNFYIKFYKNTIMFQYQKCVSIISKGTKKKIKRIQN